MKNPYFCLSGRRTYIIQGNMSSEVEIELSFPLFPLTKFFLAVLEYFIVIILRPADIWFYTRKFPGTVYLAIPDGAFPMRMPLHCNFGQVIVFILLVRYTHLMVPSDLSVTNFDPFRSTNEVLGFQAPVTKNVGV